MLGVLPLAIQHGRGAPLVRQGVVRGERREVGGSGAGGLTVSVGRSRRFNSSSRRAPASLPARGKPAWTTDSLREPLSEGGPFPGPQPTHPPSHSPIHSQNTCGIAPGGNESMGGNPPSVYPTRSTLQAKCFLPCTITWRVGHDFWHMSVRCSVGWTVADVKVRQKAKAMLPKKENP